MSATAPLQAALLPATVGGMLATGIRLRKPSILSRYIFREMAVYFAVTLALFTGILLTVRMLKLASLIINKGVELSQIATVFVAIVPSFLEIALPLSTLLGVMLAFARLSGDSELVVIRASGVSLLSLLAPVATFGVVVAAFALLNSLWLRPLGNSTLEETLFSIASTRTTSGLSQGVFNKFGDLTLYSEKIDDRTGALRGIVIDDRRNPEARQIIVAKTGALFTDQSERAIILDLGTGTIHEKVGPKYVLTNFVSNSLSFEPVDMQSGTDSPRGRKSRELTIGEIRTLITEATVARSAPAEPEESPPASTLKPPETAKSITQRLRRLEVEVTRRFSMPYAAIALAILAMALGVQPPRAQRAWGASISATLGLVVFVAYYATLSVAITISESGALPGYVALWIPNLLCAVVGSFLVAAIGLERWSSIAHGLDALRTGIGRMLPARRAP